MKLRQQTMLEDFYFTAKFVVGLLFELPEPSFTLSLLEFLHDQRFKAQHFRVEGQKRVNLNVYRESYHLCCLATKSEATQVEGLFHYCYQRRIRA